MSAPTLYGLEISVYTRIARLVALEKGVDLAFEAVDPFAEGGLPDWYRALHPFGKVPALKHGEVVFCETAAIARYLDEAFDGPALQPADPAGRARMTQIAGIVDAYGYRPMVWGLFVARRHETAPDVSQALADSRRALGALEALCAGPWLLGEAATLADCHLAPVVAYLTVEPEGREALAERPKLAAWWQRAQARAGWAPHLRTDGEGA